LSLLPFMRDFRVPRTAEVTCFFLGNFAVSLLLNSKNAAIRVSAACRQGAAVLLFKGSDLKLSYGLIYQHSPPLEEDRTSFVQIRACCCANLVNAGWLLRTRSCSLRIAE